MSRSRRPTERSAFFGRARELATMSEWLAGGTRLVTLFGPPGAGKTRLARAVPWSHGLRIECDVRRAGTLGELAQLLTDALAPGPRADHETAIERVAARLQSAGPALVVLDDAEHLVADLATAIAHWIDWTPETTFLVTSRARLGIAGESCLDVSGLDVDDAAALFVDRARRARASSVEGLDDALVRAIVERLDRLPLALELAAGRLSLLTPAVLHAQLALPLAVLKGSAREERGRSSSLRDALHDSWRSLDDDERRALMAWSALEADPSWEVALDLVRELVPGRESEALIEALVDKSLLRVEDDEGRPRVGAFTGVAAYARERIAEASLENEVAAHRAVVIRRLALRLRAELVPDDPRSIALLARELPILLRAHERASSEDRDLAVELFWLIEIILRRRGPLDFLLSRATDTLAIVDGADPIAARLLLARGRTQLELGRTPAAIDDLRRCLAQATSGNDVKTIIEGNVALGTALWTLDLREEANAALSFAQAEAERVDDVTASIDALVAHAQLHLLRADLDAAVALLERAVAQRPRLDDHAVATRLTVVRGFWAARAGQRDLARRLLDEARARRHPFADRKSEGLAAFHLAGLALARGEFSEAREDAQAAVDAMRALGDRRQECWASFHLALALCGCGAHDEARACAFEAHELALLTGDRHVQGMLCLARGIVEAITGEHAAASSTLARAADALRAFGDRQNAVTARAFAAAAIALSGRLDEARAAIAEAEDEQRARPSSRNLPALIETMRAVVDLESARRETAGDEVPRAIATLRALLARPQRNDDLQFAALLVDAVLARKEPSAASSPSSPPPRRLRVDAEGQWFCIDGGALVDLRRRRPLRLILRRLVEQRRSEVASVSLEDLVAAGWPGEKVRPDAAANRVYAALRTLRALGLRPILVTTGDGYAIDRRARIDVEP